VELFAEWHEHEIPAIQTIGAAIGHYVTGKPQSVFWWMSEQMTSATAIHTGDRFGRRLGGTRLVLVLVIAHMFYSIRTCNQFIKHDKWAIA
jgi:hypothetical protein